MKKIATRQRAVIEGKTEETIDVPDTSGLLITGCKGCTITASGKSSSVTVEKCENTTLRVGTVVASLEIIRCTAVEVSIIRCHTITVDGSTKVNLSVACQPPGTEEDSEVSKESGQQSKSEGSADDVPEAVAGEAAAVRLYTSSSDEVSINFEGLPATNSDGASFKYDVHKDFVYAKGDGPRYLSRITVDRSNGGISSSCKTLRCDQFGTPLEMADALEDGDSWTWEEGRVAADDSNPR